MVQVRDNYNYEITIRSFFAFAACSPAPRSVRTSSNCEMIPTSVVFLHIISVYSNHGCQYFIRVSKAVFKVCNVLFACAPSKLSICSLNPSNAGRMLCVFAGRWRARFARLPASTPIVPGVFCREASVVNYKVGEQQ